MKLLKNREIWISVVVFFVLAMGILGVLPFKNFARLPFAEEKILLLEWGIWIFAGLFFVRDKWLKTWFIWVLFCLILQYNKYSYGFANTILLYVLFYQILVDKLNDRRTEAILNGICMVVWVNIIFMILQQQDVWWIFKCSVETKKHLALGTMANSNNAGMLSALSIPAFLRKKWWILSPVVFISIFLTRSNGAVIAAVVGIAIYVFVKLKKWRFRIIGGLVIPVVLYIAVMEKRAFLSAIKFRFDAWKRMWDVVKLNPITGLGLGQYKRVFPAIDRLIFKSEDAHWFRAHNIYVEMAFDQGVAGLGMMAGFVCSNIERFFKNRSRLGFIAFIGVVITLVGGVFHFIAQTSSMVLPIIYMAIMVNQSWTCPQKDKDY